MRNNEKEILNIDNRAEFEKRTTEDGSVFESGFAKATYNSDVDPVVAASPYFGVVHALMQGVVAHIPFSVAGATALSKEVADTLRKGEPEKGHEPLSEQAITERVMELAAQIFAQQAVSRAAFQTLPNAEGDEATVSFTAVVMHPDDFGQLLTNIESIMVKTIERLVIEASGQSRLPN